MSGSYLDDEERLNVLLERGEAVLRSLVRSLAVLLADFFSGDDEALRKGRLPADVLALAGPVSGAVLGPVSGVAELFFVAAAAVFDEEDLVKSFGKTIEPV